MSVNACAINEFTVNSLCGRRRQIIIDLLTGKRAHPQHVHPNTREPLATFNRSLDRSHDRDEPQIPMEQPVMSVTVTIGGQQFSQAIQRDDFAPLIAVKQLSIRQLERTAVDVVNFSTRIVP